MDMSAQNIAGLVGNLLKARAETPSSSIAGANIGVTPGRSDDRYGHLVIALPGGQTFTLKIEEI